MNNITRRATALKRAAEKAQNPEFKKLWEQKLKELIMHAERGVDMRVH